LLYDIANMILNEGGVSGCPKEVAECLEMWAVQYFAPRQPAHIDVNRLPRGPCVHLGESVDDGQDRAFICHHPTHLTTNPEKCQFCPDWDNGKKAAHPPLRSFIPASSQLGGLRIRSWAVGITTTPRYPPTLECCLDSIVRAGWKTPRIFMDGKVSLPARHQHLPVTLREPKVRAWPNFYLALMELLMREPGADAYLISQDDAFFCDSEDLREYLQSALWPNDVGAVSLYCSSAYTRPQNGWHRHEGMWQWGAMAFILPRESAKMFVADPGVLQHRWCQRNAGCANIDTEIGLWSRRTRRPIFFPTPSLVQHIGDVSTLWPGARATGPRCADRFAGDISEWKT
jgi:hypothetical protein